MRNSDGENVDGEDVDFDSDEERDDEDKSCKVEAFSSDAALDLAHFNDGMHPRIWLDHFMTVQGFIGRFAATAVG